MHSERAEIATFPPDEETMKILVPTKRVPDTDQKIEVASDGMRIVDEHLTYCISPFDAIALEEAVRIRESGVDAEILAVGIGSDDYEEQLRTALAMGADRALRIACDAASGAPPDPWNVACILKAVVERESPDLVLMGKQAVDDDSNQAGQFLAAQLDWPQATFASKVQLGDGQVQVDRETDIGVEVLATPTPAVITVDLRLNEPRYASLPSIMKARKKPLETLSLDELGVAISPKIEVVGIRAEATLRQRTRLESVEQLLEQIESTLATS